MLINDGETAILTGAGYALERQTEGGWESVPLNMWFTTVGIIIEPGQQLRLSEPLPERAGAGSYRIRKTVPTRLRSGYGSDRQRPDFDVTAEPRITRPRRGQADSR